MLLPSSPRPLSSLCYNLILIPPTSPTSSPLLLPFPPSSLLQLLHVLSISLLLTPLHPLSLLVMLPPTSFYSPPLSSLLHQLQRQGYRRHPYHPHPPPPPYLHLNNHHHLQAVGGGYLLDIFSCVVLKNCSCLCVCEDPCLVHH